MDLFNPRHKSLARGNILVLVSLGAATLISHAPHLRPSPLLILPALITVIGTAETARCMRRRWDFYHGGVLMCLYMDLLAITMVLFFLFYPYFFPFSATH